MVAQMTDAMKTAKQIQTEMVQWENRLDMVKSELERTKKAKDDVQVELEKKTADYTLYVSQRDNESRRLRQEAMDQSAELAKQKAEFADILQKYQSEKAIFEDKRRSLDIEAEKVELKKAGIDSFIISVQRALSVLGL